MGTGSGDRSQAWIALETSHEEPARERMVKEKAVQGSTAMAESLVICALILHVTTIPRLRFSLAT
jgi:hypothetical protein